MHMLLFKNKKIHIVVYIAEGKKVVLYPSGFHDQREREREANNSLYFYSDAFSIKCTDLSSL